VLPCAQTPTSRRAPPAAGRAGSPHRHGRSHPPATAPHRPPETGPTSSGTPCTRSEQRPCVSPEQQNFPPAFPRSSSLPSHALLALPLLIARNPSHQPCPAPQRRGKPCGTGAERVRVCFSQGSSPALPKAGSAHSTPNLLPSSSTTPPQRFNPSSLTDNGTARFPRKFGRRARGAGTDPTRARLLPRCPQPVPGCREYAGQGSHRGASARPNRGEGGIFHCSCRSKATAERRFTMTERALGHNKLRPLFSCQDFSYRRKP